MKKLLPLIAAAALLAVAAVVVTSRNARPRRLDPELGKPLVTGLAQLFQDGAVQTIAIRSPESSATLAFGENGWTVAERGGYPADTSKLGSAMMTAADITIGQRAPASMPALDPADCTSIEWRDADGVRRAGVLLGPDRDAVASPSAEPWGRAGGGRYVARDEKSPVYIVRNSLSALSPDPAYWLDTQLLALSPTAIQSIAVRHPDGDVVNLAKPADGGDLTLADLADNEEFVSSRLYDIANAPTSLSLLDVAATNLADEVTGLSNAVVCSVAAESNTVYEVRIGAVTPDKRGRYATVKVSDAAIDARYSGWTYILSAYNANRLMPRRESFVRAKKVEEKTEEKAEEERPAGDVTQGATGVDK